MPLDGADGYPNASVLFDVLLAGEANINLRAYTSAVYMRDGATSDGRPCQFWHSSFGSTSSLEMAWWFCVAPLSPADVQLLSLAKITRPRGSLYAEYNITTEYYNISHDDEVVEVALTFGGAPCANLTASGPTSGQSWPTLDQDSEATSKTDRVELGLRPHRPTSGRPRSFSLTDVGASSVEGVRASLLRVVSRTGSQHLGALDNVDHAWPRQRHQGHRTARLVDIESLPASFDARSQWPLCGSISTIRNQGEACGSCWAHGAAESLADRYCIEEVRRSGKGVNLSLSVQVYCPATLCCCASS